MTIRFTHVRVLVLARFNFLLARFSTDFSKTWFIEAESITLPRCNLPLVQQPALTTSIIIIYLVLPLTKNIFLHSYVIQTHCMHAHC